MPTNDELQKYWDGLVSDAGLEGDEAKQLKGVLSNEGFVKALQSKFVPRPEVDKALTERQKQAEALLQKTREWEQWWNKQGLPAFQTQTEKAKRADELARRLAGYRDLYGELDGDETSPNPRTRDARGRYAAPNPASGNGDGDADASYLTRDEFTQGINRLFDLMGENQQITLEHLHRFGKPLDQAAFRRFAEEKFAEAQKTNAPITLRHAYQEFARDEIAEAEEAAYKEKLEKAVAERVEEEKKKFMRDIPGPLDTGPDEGVRVNISPDAKTDEPPSDRDRFRNWVQDWREAGGPSSF